MDSRTLLAIVGMAAATYLCRAGGYWLFRSVRPPALVQAMLRYVPGTLFISFVVPALASGGALQWVGAAATLGIMVATGHVGAAVLGGTAAAWAYWSLGIA